MNFTGLLIGIATFVSIGVFHPIVVHAEYFFSKKCWYWFLAAGLFFVVASLLVKNIVASTILGVIAFSCFWSIGELFQQEKRVLKGWFPRNPKRKEPYPEWTEDMNKPHHRCHGRK